MYSTRLVGPNGQAMSIGRMQREGEVDCQIDTVAIASRFDFAHCPLCLAVVPGTDEHVPPENIGGTVMTRTCDDCNNKAGGRTEPELEHWWNDTLVRARLESTLGPVRGPRVAGNLYRRQTSDGEPVFALAGKHDSAVRDILDHGGDITLTFGLPDRARVFAAALKSAYLGACLLARRVPFTREAEAVRAALRAARDTQKSEPLSLRGIDFDWWIARRPGSIEAGRIGLERVRVAGEEPQYAVSLGGALLVSWPVGGYLVGSDRASDRILWIDSMGANSR
ncbi:HNH endonuclease [Glycomyces sp. L485]|uniref:HNH endonuclease n=1 Tax=Glycomyces sp. L485 TaxID=2909235 RepID=UPI001F4B3421|nr:HNH endonuclease [Glycomyces sp. L485]MCH7229947.1 HNH endonuclease [Glycomyces sp. L485]